MSQTEKHEDHKVITGEKRIGVLVGIHAKDARTFYEINEKIRNDFISVVKHYEKENTDEIRVFLRDEPRCARCGNTYPQCTCGRPNRSPAV